MRHLLKGVVAVVATGGMLGLAAPAAFADDHEDARQSVNVVGDGSTVTIDEATVQAGSISFKVASTNAVTETSGGSQITLFQPKKGVTLEQVFADLAEEFSQGDLKATAMGTRDLTRDITAFGLADVIPDYPVVVTERLRRGTYYLMDLANPPQGGAPKLTQLTVTGRRGDDRGSGLDSQVRVRATSDDRFIAPDSWPHEGTYTFRNVSDTLHFMGIDPVEPGTTDDVIQAYFDSPAANDPGNPPFAVPGGPYGGNDVVSPGRSIQVSYDLPAGTYVLLCFVADDVTGMPHALMGMHKVITLT
jgi:hypothetical protein